MPQDNSRPTPSRAHGWTPVQSQRRLHVQSFRADVRRPEHHSMTAHTYHNAGCRRGDQDVGTLDAP
eukprot:999483-Alexandrium_andersonii.AAC.1